ncbi:MAG: isochorismatase family protein, partial [Armatimonadetes bacterium]|nr:isochorismatase family protein [Armatimonadota bacterium]
VWHDACEETRELALIYDAIFPGLQGDESLVSFLAAKAARYHLPNPKNSLADILRNIENGIFRDALRNQHKIASNFPRTPVALATIMAVLDWDGAQDSIYKLFDETFPRATAVDGVTGEKGLRNYSAFVIQGLAEMLGYFSRVDPGFIRKLLGRYPRLRETYRFHIDTWCMEAYYPHSGDTGWLGSRDLKYVGVTFDRGSPSSPDTVSQWIIRPSGYKFLWDLYKATGDADYVKVLYKANGSRTDGLPHDLFCADPVQFQKAVARVIAKHGAQVALRSVNKQQWCLAILRSGQGDHSRVVWLDYDAGGGHGHADAMNLGLFAYGLDLLPDFGYPPVQFGGWGSPRAAWYGLTAAHNTVVVNRASQQAGSGATTLWGDGQAVHVIRASAPAVYSIPQYSRSVALIDISDRDFYCADVFWVVGGGEHIKFVQGPPGKVSTRRLDLKPAEDLGSGTILRDLQLDPSAPAGWQADFSVEDIHSYLPPGRKVKMRYHDLTGDAAAGVCQAWAAVSFESTEELWLPRLVVQRRGQVPLASTFVGVFQPYLSRPPIVAVRRLPVEARSGVPYGQSVVAVECTLTDGRRDLLIFADSENPLGSQPDFRELRNLRQPDWQLSTDAEFCFVRLDAKGRVERAAIAKGTRLRAGSAVLHLKRPADFIEVVFLPAPRVVSGDPDIVASVGTIAAGAVKKPMRTLTVRAYYYQHFDADFSRDVPAEGYGGWKEAEIDLSLDHTAVALMHVWDTGTREEYPGWHRAVEYIPRAEQICRTVLPRLLKAVREAKFPLVHIVGGGNYYQDLPGYREVVQLAGPPPPPPEQVEADEVLQRLRAFRASRVFPGAHNQPDIDRGFARIDFHPVAKPLPQEPVVENAHQLFAWCRAKGINHLIYAGFAVNWCLLMSPGGMIDMSRHGLMCSVFRDATTAVENRESARAELNKQEALWRVALAFGFVFDTEDFIAALRSQAQ